jgi:hypothetical protein
MLAVLGGGLIAFRRDLRLWFFAFVLVLCGFASFASRGGQIAPEAILSKIPVVDNVIVQRFMCVGFLAAAVVLGIVVDRIRSLGLARTRPSPASVEVRDTPAHDVVASAPPSAAQFSDAPPSREAPDTSTDTGRPGARSRRHATSPLLATLAALAAAAVALVPMAVTFGPRLPFTMEPVILPRWYAEVAPNLPAGQVLLSYPAPFSGIQSSLAWQAVNRMHYSQAGGGGPQGVAWRAGPARPGFTVLQQLALSFTIPPPTGTPAQRSAVRRALQYWRVTKVVIASNPTAPRLQRGTDPLYAASFMTAVLGRLPTLEAGAWVWNDVDAHSAASWTVRGTDVARCVAIAEGRAGSYAPPTMRGPECIARAAASARSR